MSTIAMTRNPVFHNRTKHIEIRHHFIRELEDKKEITLQFCRTDEQLADIFTKAITSEKFTTSDSNSEYKDVSRLRGSIRN